MENDVNSLTSEQTTTTTTIPIWLKLCLWSGLAVLGLSLIFPAIGIVRGYSIQSYIPNYIFLGGLVLIQLSSIGMLFVLRHEKPQKSYTPLVAILLIPFCMQLDNLPGIQHGRYRKQADELYKQKNYSAALEMYQKEIDTWYLRLTYNYNETISLFGIAESQCQLGNFEQARQTYQRLINMSRGYYKGRGQDELNELDTELKNIAAYQEQLDNTADDSQKAHILFDLALAYRKIECGQKAREQYALIQTLNAHDMQKEQAKKFAADETW